MKKPTYVYKGVRCNAVCDKNERQSLLKCLSQEDRFNRFGLYIQWIPVQPLKNMRETYVCLHGTLSRLVC